ncbi:hypothetical protein M0R72_15535 [Candidatus Pacearchaeota archaeon]|jgi:hypothetical protein|nr:hypothetical protein [Candidatus Pacearchaeota archaeon]
MILVIKNGLVIATHRDEQRITQDMYPGCEIASWDGKLILVMGPVADPRTESEKNKRYKDARKLEYPNLVDQLDMLYWDKINGTSTWEAEITRIKEKYPKS